MRSVEYGVGHQERRSGRLRFWALALCAFLASVYLAPGSADAKSKVKRVPPTAASIIVDAESGTVLYESNSGARTYPASLTKMMTLYLLFEAIEAKRVKLDDMLPVSAHAAVQPATDLALRAGQSISVEKAILALIVHSANDVAVVVAEALGGTEDQFAARMTKKARELGMTSTQYNNASGLPDPGQVTNARDVAILARALITRFPGFYPYFATETFTYGGRVYTTHNRVVENYSGADGLKTGYIRASGYNVATSAVRNGRRIIAVVMGGRSAYARDAQMMALLDQGFVLATTQPKTQVAAAKLPQAPRAGATQVASATAQPPKTGAAAAAVGAPTMLMPATKSAALGAPATPPADAVTVQVSSALPVTDAAPVGDPEQDIVETQIASIEPTAAPTTNSTSNSKAAAAKGRWGIQVGAFNAYKMALNAANRASKRVAKLVKDAQIVVDETGKGNATLYRARLVGLTKQNAHSACRQLKAKSFDCMVFQADVALAMNPTP
ncbi:MAG TPA: serine hydrolase [Candidatus Acidoferrum sp.]|nr:serine hydrolase [Candidatus Acidoferrum sp.]